MIQKKTLSERDICTKFITTAIVKAGWNTQTQLLEEVTFTDGKLYVRGKLDQTRRGDFKYFKDKMTVVKNRQVDKSYELYLAL
jgi:type I restriction enzyme R subunit